MKPPVGYPSEPKAPGSTPPHAVRCGWTWAKRVTVSGRLPNGFGAQYTHELAPVMPVASLLQIGWDGPVEADRRRTLESRIATVDNQLRLASSSIDPVSVASIAWLLEGALAELARAASIHRKWLERAGGSFPLQWQDRVTNFRKACAGHMGRTIQENRVELVCPLLSELKTRESDRKRIREAFQDAAAHVRCAEYWLWRVMLYRNALADWHATRRPMGAGGFALPPVVPPEPLDLTQVPPPPLPPRRGTLVNPPELPPGVDPGTLVTPPDVPPEVDEGIFVPGWAPGTGPDTASEPVRTGTRHSSGQLVVRGLAVGAAVVTVFILAR